ncbi:Fic family protein [Mesorhizobium sp. M1348]
MLAFGFVYIHPFEDGNGRIHRHWSNGNRRRNSTSGC